MARAIVVSDTHDNLRHVLDYLESADTSGQDVKWLIHLGDIVSPFTLRRLARAAGEKGLSVIAVFGNNCGEKLGLLRVAREAGVDLGEAPRTVEVGGRRLLLVHGFGSKENTLEIVNALAVSNRWDAILYGHTHEADLRVADGTLILNPGDAGGSLERPSIAVLDLERLEADIVWL